MQAKGFMLVSCRFHACFTSDPADRSKLEFGDAEECVSKCGIPFLGRWVFALIAPCTVSRWFHAGFMPVSGQMPPIVVNK